MAERIVIVDGDEGVLGLLDRVLATPDREIRLFTSAAPALTALRRAPADLVLSDPSVAGGDPLLAEMRDLFGASLGLIVMTAFPSLVADADAVEEGIGAYLRKPLSDLELVRSTVNHVLERVLQERDQNLRPDPGEVQERLLRHRSRLSRAAAVLAQIQDGILVTDRQGRLVQGNSAASRLLQGNVHEWLGRPLVDLRIPDALRAQLSAPATTEPSRARLVLGIDRVVEAVVLPLNGADGRALGRCVVLSDVTSEVQVASLRRHYLTAVSHELRTPLTTLQNLLTLLDREAGDLTTRAAWLLEGMSEQARRLEHQIHKLILLARLDGERRHRDRERCPLHEILSEVLDACHGQAESQGVELLVDPSVHLDVEAHRDDLERALYELVENALKFTPPGGSVRIEGQREEACGRVLIVDTGIGIAAEDHRRIFEDFRQLERPHTRTYPGAGLGLALAQKLIQASGGEIEVQSALDQGSTFAVSLPLWCGSPYARRAAQPAET